MSIIESILDDANIQYKKTSHNGITPVLELERGVNIYLDDDGLVGEILTNGNVYRVIDDNDILITYCTTTDLKLAKKVYNEVRKTTKYNKFASIKIDKAKMHTTPPLLTYIFYPEHVDEFNGETWQLEICVEDGDSNFDAEWSGGQECYVLKAYTLAQAKKILKQKYKVSV